MSKNDYHVLYLYECLKNDETPSSKELNNIALLSCVNERYWHYILRTLLDAQFISGGVRVDVDNTFERVLKVELLEITPAGIEYLTDNSLMAKVKKFIKTTKEIAPFV